MRNKPFKGRIEDFYDIWLASGKHKYTDTGNTKPVPRLAKSMVSCGLALAIDGTLRCLIDFPTTN